MKIKHSKEWYYWAYIVTYIIGMAFCILPALIAGLVKLPVIATKNATSTLSGVFVTVVIVCALPLVKVLFKLIKSPNAAVICWLFFIGLSLVCGMEDPTREGLKDVLLFAAIGNTVGMILFRISAEFEKHWKYCGQVNIIGGDK